MWFCFLQQICCFPALHHQPAGVGDDDHEDDQDGDDDDFLSSDVDDDEDVRKKLCRIREWAICSSHVDQLPIAEQSLLLHHFASGHDDDQDGADDIDNNIHL